MRPLGWLCLLAGLLGGTGQEQLRLGVPLRAASVLPTPPQLSSPGLRGSICPERECQN